MRLVTPLRRAVMRGVYSRRLNSRWGKVLAGLDVWPLDAARLDGSGNLTWGGLGTSITEPTPAALTMIENHRVCGDLGTRAGAKFDIRQDHIAIEVGGVKGVARNRADLQVFHEIFVERFYSFEYPGSFFVIDVGANLGLASLFFASEYQAEVVAYELVPSTVQMAQENLNLNPKLSSRIRLEAVGLADKDAEIEIEVDAAIRSSNSLYETNLTETRTKETVQVIDAGPAIQAAIEQAAGRTLVLKLDAEGAEYEIFERMQALGLLSKVDVLFLEWHERTGKDPATLRDMLRQAGFIWTERQHTEAPVGLINGFNKSRC